MKNESLVIYNTTTTELVSQRTCIGIDLGTTYSLMALVEPSEVNFKETNTIPVKFAIIPQHSPNEYDLIIEDEKVASIVAIKDGRPFVGNNLYRLKGHPDFKYKKNIFYNWKIEMGVDQHPMYPNAVIDKLNMPYKIAGGILNYMRKSYNPTSDFLENTIITVPASFQINQRNDTLKAAEMAKIETHSQMLIDEPNAAFLGYFNRLTDGDKQSWAKNVRNKNVLVVDFGGGTLDLSILNVDFKIEHGITISNRAISRYNDLGGQDIDYLIAEEFLLPTFKSVCPEYDTLDLLDIQQSILPQLAVIGEDLKIGICSNLSMKAGSKSVEELDLQNVKFSRTDCEVSYKGDVFRMGDISLNGKEFKDLFAKLFRGKSYKFKYLDKLVTSVSSSIGEVIEKASMTLDEINYVLFVGGSSLNPFLASLAEQKLVNSKSLSSHEPDKLVAEGAAVYSYFLNVHHLSLISPIASETIGVRLKGNQFKPIIERGQHLPQKVELPQFKLQTNLVTEVVVPVCINGTDYPIGEIRCALKKTYNIDTTITIKAEVTIDKVLSMQVYADGEMLGKAEFDNPYSIGHVSEEQLAVLEAKAKMNKARVEGDRYSEKDALRSLIWKQNDAGNHLGTVECAEEYIKRFDDEDSAVWNMKYIGNKGLGRQNGARESLLRAIEIEPYYEGYHYNYSLLLENESIEQAIDYLESLDDDLKEEGDVKLKLILLKHNGGMDTKEVAREVVNDYKNHPDSYSDFQKQVFLPWIFKIVDEPYSYVDPKMRRRQDDETKYLDNLDIPF
jgi:molecular chaperone DnaK (HSP70)